MAGYAATWELNLAGPWGTAAWLVVGTGLTVASIWAVDKAVSRSKSDTDAKAVPKAAECQDCNKRQYSIFVRAQGSDLPGGQTKSTVQAATLTQQNPFMVAQGIALSAATQGQLSNSQLKIRAAVFLQLERFISKMPSNGGWLGEKDFVVPGERGGIRADTGSFGPSNNYIS